MREESHLEDMRSAIRGDFERLERRRGRQELMHIVPEAAAGPDPDPAPTAPVEPATDAPASVRRSWLDRLRSR